MDHWISGQVVLLSESDDFDVLSACQSFSLFAGQPIYEKQKV